MAGLPNFGSSFADALLGTMSALDARKRAQREEKQWAEEDAMKEALKNATKEGQPVGVRGEPVGRFADEAQADEAIKGPTRAAIRSAPAAMAPSVTSQMSTEDINKAVMAPTARVPGNIDTSNRPHVTNPDGSVSTVRTVGFGLPGGRAVNVPTVSEDGRIMSNAEALQQYKDTGRNLGIYGSDADAAQAAQALHLEQQAQLEAQNAPIPTVGEEADARAANLVKFKDKAGQWVVADKANARTANKYDVMAERAAIYQQYGKEDMALALQSRAEAMLDRDAARNQKAALRILNTTGDINSALQKLSENDDVTLGAHLQMIQNKDGTYSVGAAPDGTGLPPKALPGLTAKNPDDLRTLLNGVISDNFLGAQQMIFNQMVSLKGLEHQDKVLAETSRHNKVEEGQGQQRIGLAAAAARRSPASGGSGGLGGFKFTNSNLTYSGDGGRIGVPRQMVRDKNSGQMAYTFNDVGGGQVLVNPRYAQYGMGVYRASRAAATKGLELTADGQGNLQYVNPKSGTVVPIPLDRIRAYDVAGRKAYGISGAEVDSGDNSED